MRRFPTLAGIWTPETYDRIARRYDRFARLIAPIGEQAQRKLVEDLSSGSILDVGCGTGTLLDLANAQGLRPHGIDTSPGMLAQARAKVPGAQLGRASFYELPFADGSFDYVMETNALSGVAIGVESALREMLRVCKSGGEVRIADYTAPQKETLVHRLLKQLGILIGDYPYNYRALFGKLGYEPQVEILGGYGMYKYFRVEKREPVLP